MDKNYGHENLKSSFGLIGKNIGYSFSKQYFTDKFHRLNAMNYEFHNFDLDDLNQLPKILKNNPHLKGFSVTIPFKEKIIPYLDSISTEAQEIGAVNCVKIHHQKLIGYNTDCIGFELSFKTLLLPTHRKALVLGTGGASKAVQFVLKKLNISYLLVSRNPSNKHEISYQSLSSKIIEAHQIIINCSPVGTYPSVDDFPQIPYNCLTTNHFLYDLIYNPLQTEFLKKGKARGSLVKNGFDMLTLQAEKAWEIWSNPI